MGTTMREQRIVAILNDLSIRVAEYNTTMDDLMDSFNQGRMASKQILKRAHRCIAMADVAMCRFLAIARTNHFDEECALVKVFHRRRAKFNKLELFFH